MMGLERQIKGKPAGLKTNTLVAVGSAVFMIISLLFKGEEGTDMTRTIGQICVGVGFLGAGVILQRKKKKKIEGLATAATIWCCAGCGCLAALELYVPLALFTGIVVIINVAFGYLNHKLEDNAKQSDGNTN